LEDVIYLGNDLLTTADGVVVGLVETVGRCVQELDETMRGQLGDHLVGVLLGDVQLVVLHEGRPEERHSTDRFNINLLKSCQDYPPHQQNILPKLNGKYIGDSRGK
jgi:hypothetical protein